MIRRSLVFCLFLMTSLAALANDGSEKKFRHVLLIKQSTVCSGFGESDATD